MNFLVEACINVSANLTVLSRSNLEIHTNEDSMIN